jgi:hypothetical protein
MRHFVAGTGATPLPVFPADSCGIVWIGLWQMILVIPFAARKRNNPNFKGFCIDA